MSRSPTTGNSAGTVAGSPSGFSPAILAAAFALFVFVVTSFRAAIDPDGPVDVFSDKRIVATLLGAGIYWLTLRMISERIHAPIGEIVRAVLKIVIIGSASLLVVRAAMDMMASVSFDVSIARNVRWLLLWLGYFASWVAGFVAHAYYLRLRAPTVAAVPDTDRGAVLPVVEQPGYECVDPLMAEFGDPQRGRSLH